MLALYLLILAKHGIKHLKKFKGDVGMNCRCKKEVQGDGWCHDQHKKLKNLRRV